MGFDIFAAGTGTFHYSRKGCEDGSGFELIKMVSALQSLDAKSINHFNISGKGAEIDIAAPGIADLEISLAKIEMLHNLSNAVCLLAMNPNASEGWIALNATEINWFSPNKARGATYTFSTDGSPAADLISAIGPCLTDTNMTNFGVLMQLSVALTKYVNAIDDSTAPKISISLTN
jgi:hypothetical protein